MKVILRTMDRLEMEVELKDCVQDYYRPIYRHNYGSTGFCEDAEIPEVNPLRSRIYSFNGEKKSGVRVYEEQGVPWHWAEALDLMLELAGKLKRNPRNENQG